MGSETEIVVSTSTDSQPVAEAAANDDQEGARAPIEQSSLSEFRQSADGAVVSYESPQSERQTLLDRLQEHSNDLAEFQVDPELEGQGEPEAGDVDLAAVRKAATEHAIRDGEAWVRQQQAEHFTGVDEYNQAMQQAHASFQERLEEIKAKNPDFPQLVAQLERNDIPISQPLVEAFIAIPGGADALLHLARNPREARQLANMPDHVAVAKIGQLAARFTAPKLPVSRAPRPITPVSGTAKSTLPLDELPYQEYRKIRDREEKSRYRR